MNLNIQQNKYYSPIYLPKGTTKLNINENGLFDSIHLDEPRVIVQSDDYLDLIQQDELELFGVHFRFSDDLWDFSSKAEEFQKKYIFRFKFKKIESDEFKTLSKLFVLNDLLEYGLNRPYLYNCLLSVVEFLNFLYFNYMNIEDLDITELDSYFEKQKVSPKTKATKKCNIKKVIEFYCTITDKMIDHDVLSYLEEIDTQKINAQLIQNKTKLLSHSIMKPLVQLLYTEFKNCNLNVTYRRCLALLYIDTQCGIRPGELLMLSNDCIVKQEVFGKILYQLRYKSTKGVKGNGYKIYMTIANERVEEAVNYLQKFNNDSDTLGKGLTTADLNDSLKNIVATHIKKFNEGDLNKYGYNGFPRAYQFRVYFASELKRRGYNDMIISKMLGHDDEKMWGYYARPADSIQEDWEYSKQLIKNVQHEDLKIMGAKGNIYEQKIKHFCDTKSVNVEISEDEIIEKILDELPIRQKCGGFCIKPNSSRPCEMNNEEESDNILCAYEICPNQCHVYYDCYYYYKIYNMQKKAVEANLKGGFKNAAQKELYKLQNILRDRLIPELNEFEKEIERKGIETILNKHPNLEFIYRNMEEIMEDIKEWMRKKI